MEPDRRSPSFGQMVTVFIFMSNLARGRSGSGPDTRIESSPSGTANTLSPTTHSLISLTIPISS